MTDYPFSNWTDYFKALSESLISVDFDIHYPAYGAEQEKDAIRADLRIIQSLLAAGADPQEGFDGLLKTFLVSCRYSPEMIESDEFPVILQAFKDKGVALEIDILLRFYFATGQSGFEDECANSEARGRLLLALGPFFPDLLDRLETTIGWSSIKPVYWEEADQPTTDEELRSSVYAAMKFVYIEAGVMP